MKGWEGGGSDADSVSDPRAAPVADGAHRSVGEQEASQRDRNIQLISDQIKLQSGCSEFGT